MKIEWLFANVTAVGSPDREERAILGVILAWQFFGRFRTYFVTAVGSPDRAEPAILEAILAGRLFDQIRPYLFVVGESLWDEETPS